jgi:hypothetical protein
MRNASGGPKTGAANSHEPQRATRNASGGPKTGAANSSEPQRTSFVCACCGRTVVTAIEGLFYNLPVGSKQRFCDSACRQAALRRRRAGVSENAPLQRQGGRSRRLGQGLPAGRLTEGQGSHDSGPTTSGATGAAMTAHQKATANRLRARTAAVV